MNSPEAHFSEATLILPPPPAPSPSKVKEFIKLLIPPVSWIPAYRLNNIKYDVIGGITLASILIPQSIAYAMLANLPAASGLYSSIMPTCIYFIFGSCRFLSFGPFALISLLLASAASSMNVSTEDFTTCVFLISFVAGLFQILFFFIELMASFLFQLRLFKSIMAKHVMAGFVTASGFFIAASQIPAFLGFKINASSGPGSFFINLISICRLIPQTNLYSFAFSSVALVSLIAFHFIKKKFPKLFIPDILLIVIVGTVICHFVPSTYQIHRVAIVGEIPSGLPHFFFPFLQKVNWGSLIGNALIISFVATVTTLSIIDAFSTPNEPVNISEIFAMGIANTFSSMFQSYLACASLSRSALLFTLKVRSPIANMISVLIVIFTCLFLAPLIREMPIPVLAAVIIFALYSIISQLATLPLLYASNKLFFAQFLFSFLFVLSLDVQYGILACIVISLGSK